MALWLTHPMAKLVIPVEPHLDGQPPTYVIQDTCLMKIALVQILVSVKLMDCGLVHHSDVYVSHTVCVCMMYTSHRL